MNTKRVTARIADWDVQYNSRIARVNYADGQPFIRFDGGTVSEWKADTVLAAEQASGCRVIPDSMQIFYSTYIVSLDCTKRP